MWVCIFNAPIVGRIFLQFPGKPLPGNDTYGIDLAWGNPEALVEMVRKIGERTEGLGYLLGEGVKIAAEKIGRGSERTRCGPGRFG